MTVPKITTHGFDALKRFMAQYEDVTNLPKVISIYTKQIQELEDAMHPLFALLSIEDMIGAQLDNIGEIVGQPRPGTTLDPEYRVLIYIKIGQNISNGEPERIIAIFKLLTGSAWVHYLNHEGAEYSITAAVVLATQEAVNEIIRGIHSATAAGVRFNRIVCADETEAFAFAGVNPNAPAKGFGSTTDPAAGGKFAQSYEFKLDFAFAGSDKNAAGFGSTQDPLVGGVFTP